MIEGVHCVGQLLFAVGVGCGSQLGYEACFVISLVDDDDRVKGGRCTALCHVGRPLYRGLIFGEDVRWVSTVISTCACAAAPAGCTRELLCPVFTHQSCSLGRREAIGAAWAKGYGHPF